MTDDKRSHERSPEVEKEREVGRHPERGPREMGTHQGGKLSPPHKADRLHGDPPADLPPRLKGV